MYSAAPPSGRIRCSFRPQSKHLNVIFFDEHIWVPFGERSFLVDSRRFSPCHVSVLAWMQLPLIYKVACSFSNHSPWPPYEMNGASYGHTSEETWTRKGDLIMRGLFCGCREGDVCGVALSPTWVFFLLSAHFGIPFLAAVSFFFFFFLSLSLSVCVCVFLSYVTISCQETAKTPCSVGPNDVLVFSPPKTTRTMSKGFWRFI